MGGGAEKLVSKMSETKKSCTICRVTGRTRTKKRMLLRLPVLDTGGRGDKGKLMALTSGMRGREEMQGLRK